MFIALRPGTGGPPRPRFVCRPFIVGCCMALLTAPARGQPTADGTGAAAAVVPAGIARGIITPEQPMWMAGYGSRDHRAEGKVHDLHVKAVAIGEPAVVLVTLDLVGIDRVTTRRITDRLAERHGIGRERVAINCSHTHCGPIVGSTLETMFSLPQEDLDLRSAYTRMVEDRVVDCVGRALADRKPARVSWGNGTCAVAVNRRENKEAEVPAIRAAGRPLRGPFDHDVPVLAIHDEAGGIRAAVFGYACHATVLSFYRWCGDYPGFACLEWERRHPSATAIFWAGCGGDQNPLPRRTVELAEAYAVRLADAVDAVLDEGALRPIAGRIEARYDEVPLALAAIPDRAVWERTLAEGNAFEKSRARHLLGLLDRDGRLDAAYPAYPVQAWRLGDGGPRWVFLGGEVVVDYAVRLKAEFGRDTTWVAAYSNDVMAYIPSRRVLGEGGYEGAGAMLYYGLPAPWAESVEERIVDAVRSVVKPLPATDGGR